MRVTTVAELEGTPGFATHHYFDRNFDRPAMKILPGEFYVTDEDMAIVTVLGSCVSACIRDPRAGLGGMNHFMLPDNDSRDPADASARYGIHAMEVLINSLIKMGARRSHLEAKVFGGGNVLSNLTHSNVGQRNARFVLEFLRTEHIHVAAKDLEDVYPRKVAYFPITGKVMMKKLKGTTDDTVVRVEKDYRTTISHAKVGGDVELFS